MRSGSLGAACHCWRLVNEMAPGTKPALADVTDAKVARAAIARFFK